MRIRDKRRRRRGAFRAGAGFAALVVMAVLSMAGAGAAAAQGLAMQGPEAERRYTACMQLARKDAGQAQTAAAEWHAKGGGAAAMHCLSVALLSLGYYQQAAENMEALARGKHKLSAALRSDLYGQAGNAWSIAGKPARALRAQSAALKLRPDDADLLIDRGITLAGSARYWDALDDLNRALEIAPGRVEALVFRAAAWRRLDSLELAEEDIRRALRRAPENRDALLERGLIFEARGDFAAARADWLRVLEPAADGPLAEAARGYLERIDVKRRPPSSVDRTR